MDCKITADSIGFDGNPITKFYLGRPWQAAPRTVFLRCEEPATLDPAGWLTWNVAPALYAEYMCTGPGSDYSNRISISRQLTGTEATDYTLQTIFAKTANPNLGYDWLPVKPIIITSINKSSLLDEIPTSYALRQNYPNPFNPTTMIEYSLPKTSRVKLVIYNLLGAEAMTLVDDRQTAGRYKIHVDASHLASAIYFYSIQAEDFHETKKMLLLK